eukprot:SM000023S07535  [mRNA]  locus=s23:43045:44620:+ [translate_table: standard]
MAAAAAAAAGPEERFRGRVLAPGSDGPAWWDARAASYPCVVGTGPGAWRMYYYGRDRDEWARGVALPFAKTPTGRVGMAVSADGVAWTRFRGPLPGGAVFDPNDHDEGAFDAVQVGVSDVHAPAPGSDASWQIYYFGGGLEALEVPGGPPLVGVRQRPGVVASPDGVHFTRAPDAGPLLDIGAAGDFDENSVAWPRVLAPLAGSSDGWLMTYHTLSFATGFSVGAATSATGAAGDWAKRGRVLGRGPPGSWDEGGASTRCLLRCGSGQLAMLYEGVRQQSRYAIGLAFSDDGGLTWEKDGGSGGPVFAPSSAPSAWDNLSVGTPNLVAMDDGSLRLYYTGQGKLGPSGEEVRGFGLAVNASGDLRSWERWPSGQ